MAKQESRSVVFNVEQFSLKGSVVDAGDFVDDASVLVGDVHAESIRTKGQSGRFFGFLKAFPVQNGKVLSLVVASMNTGIGPTVLTKVQYALVVIAHQSRYLIGLLIERTTPGGMVRRLPGAKIQNDESFLFLGDKVEHSIHHIDSLAFGIVRFGVFLGFRHVAGPTEGTAGFLSGNDQIFTAAMIEGAPPVVVIGLV